MPEAREPIQLYFIRHAETVMNRNPHKVGGRSNETPLTKMGIKQAKRLGRILFQKGILPSKVFVSPAVRTIDTAAYSLAEMGLDIKPLIHDAIQELSQGPAEGKPRKKVYTKAILEEIERLGKDFKLEGGESMNDVGLRMHGWIEETFGTGSIDEPAINFVYTHGGAIKNLASYIEGWDHQQTYQTEIHNTSVSLFRIIEGVCTVEYLNRDVEDI